MAHLTPAQCGAITEILTQAIALASGGEPMPFTFFIWHPEQGVLHATNVSKDQLVGPLRKVADVFELEAGLVPANDPSGGQA